MDLDIDTTDPTYQQLLAGLGVLRNRIAEQLPSLRALPRPLQREWLERDPLLRRTILLSRQLAGIVEEELAE